MDHRCNPSHDVALPIWHCFAHFLARRSHNTVNSFFHPCWCYVDSFSYQVREELYQVITSTQTYEQEKTMWGERANILKQSYNLKIHWKISLNKFKFLSMLLINMTWQLWVILQNFGTSQWVSDKKINLLVIWKDDYPNSSNEKIETFVI